LSVLKRITLFLITNLAVLVLLSIVWNVLSATGVIPPDALGGYGPLLAMASVFGFGGALISLLASKWIAKFSTGARVIDSPRNQREAWLLETVRRHAERAGIGMPEVAIYESPEPNAFATGATRNSALVAVSTGLLDRMGEREVDAVLGHEVSHVANGDMVTLTLIQGVLNTFVIFFARIVGSIVDSALRRDDEGRSGTGLGYFATVLVCELVFGLFASLIVAWFSRRREFRADAGGAALAGRQNMVNALRRLGGEPASDLPKAMAAFGIRSGTVAGFFSSHPPLDERIRRLMETSGDTGVRSARFSPRRV
jgi:heat shock protein HtpX